MDLMVSLLGSTWAANLRLFTVYSWPQYTFCNGRSNNSYFPADTASCSSLCTHDHSAQSVVKAHKLSATLLQAKLHFTHCVIWQSFILLIVSFGKASFYSLHHQKKTSFYSLHHHTQLHFTYCVLLA